MLNQIKKLIGILFAGCLLMQPSLALKGIQKHYESIGYYYVEVNLEHYQINLHWKDHQNQPFRTIANVIDFMFDQKKEKVLFATNSGIYDADYRPLGLHIENGVILSKLNKTNPNNPKGNFSMKPNGVFFIENNEAQILETNQFNQIVTQKNQIINNISVAVQSGPLMISKGKIHPKFIKESTSLKYRSAVCVKDKKNLIFAVSMDQTSFYHFSQFLLELNCSNALYLDGSLSRIYFDHHYYGVPFWKLRPYAGILSITEKAK